MPKSYHPFSNATEFMFWNEANCDRCAKADHDSELDEIPCPIQRAIVMAACLQSVVSESVAIRMGYLQSGEEVIHGGYDCTERLDTSEIAEEKRRAAEFELPIFGEGK